MKKAFTLFVFVVAAIWQLGAQIPQNSPIPAGFRIETEDGLFRTFSYRGASDWGDTLLQSITAEMVWAQGLDSLGNETDSLVCDSMASSLAGKIALIRRGGCEFGFKSHFAEEAGALAVVICNWVPEGQEINGVAGGIPNMGGGAFGAQVGIPVLAISKEDGDLIGGKLDAGIPVTGFLEVRSFGGPRTAYAYQTPQEGIKPLADMGVTFINIDNATTIPNLSVNAVVTAPNGQATTITQSLTDVQPLSVNTVVFSDSYTPSAVGTYNVKFTNSVTPDELEQSFIITDDHTYALDNGDLIPNTNGTLELETGRFKTPGVNHSALNFHIGNVYRTGPNPVKATHVTFVLGNYSELYTGEPASDIMYINIYDADPDGNGTVPMTSFPGYGGLNENSGLVFPVPGSSTEYVFKETDQDFQFTTVKLPSAVTLGANKIYLVTVQYDGLSAALGIPPKFAFGGDAPQAGEIGSMIYWRDSLRADGGGFDVNYFLRLHLEGFENSTQEPLDDNKVTLTPTPASKNVNLELRLDNVAEEVDVRIYDFTGRMVSNRTLENVQEGRYSFDVSRYANGTYFMAINTPEGFRSKKFQVQH